MGLGPRFLFFLLFGLPIVHSTLLGVFFCLEFNPFFYVLLFFYGMFFSFIYLFDGIRVFPKYAQNVTMHVKIGWKKVKDMSVWLNKMVLAQQFCTFCSG